MGRKNGNRYWAHSKQTEEETSEQTLPKQEQRPSRRRRARGDVKTATVRDAYVSA